MLWVGLISDDDSVRSMVAARMGELGAIVGGNGAEQTWKAGDPAIVVHAIASRVRETSRPYPHVVVGIPLSEQ